MISVLAVVWIVYGTMIVGTIVAPLGWVVSVLPSTLSSVRRSTVLWRLDTGWIVDCGGSRIAIAAILLISVRLDGTDHLVV